MDLKHSRQAFKPVLNLLPVAIVIWNPERSKCLLNYVAREITGFTERELWGHPPNWLARVHPDDRNAILAAWQKLEDGHKNIVCDYYFLPNHQQRMIRLRENSVPLRNSEGRMEAIISSFSDLSDLKARHAGSQEAETFGSSHESLIRPLVHEIRNGLHMIRMGVDCMSLDQDKAVGNQAITSGIERVSELTLELRDYFVPSRPQFTVIEPDILLAEAIQSIETELEHRGIRVRFAHRKPLPHVRLDPVQIRNAFKRVMEFCQALLSKGGELEINAGLKTMKGREYVELKLASSTGAPLDVNEANVFQPFLQVNGIQVGLSMAIAREILHRHQGQIIFRKEAPRRGLITILLKVSSAHRNKKRVDNMFDIGGSCDVTEQSEQQR